jgi:hypothetical protein
MRDLWRAAEIACQDPEESIRIIGPAIKQYQRDRGGKPILKNAREKENVRGSLKAVAADLAFKRRVK